MRRNHWRHPETRVWSRFDKPDHCTCYTSLLSTRAVAASESDVLVTHLAIPHAGDYSDSVSAGPWYMTAWSGSMRPVMAELSVCPTFSRMKLGRSAVLLVSPGWAPMASSCILILRCRATAGSSGRQCVLPARCWNIRNSRAGASTSWSFSSRGRQVHLRAMGCVKHQVGAT